MSTVNDLGTLQLKTYTSIVIRPASPCKSDRMASFSSCSSLRTRTKKKDANCVEAIVEEESDMAKKESDGSLQPATNATFSQSQSIGNLGQAGHGHGRVAADHRLVRHDKVASQPLAHSGRHALFNVQAHQRQSVPRAGGRRAPSWDGALSGLKMRKRSAPVILMPGKRSSAWARTTLSDQT